MDNRTQRQGDWDKMRDTGVGGDLKVRNREMELKTQEDRQSGSKRKLRHGEGAGPKVPLGQQRGPGWSELGPGSWTAMGIP